MKKIKKVVFVLVLLILLSGCGEKTSTKSKKEEVKDNTIISTLTNQIISLEQLTKTRDLYTKGEGKGLDYTDEEKIRFGVESRIAQGGVPVLSKEDMEQLQVKGITNVVSYVDLAEVAEYINANFEEPVKTFATVSGCPAYTYDEGEKKFYVQASCQTDDATTIVSMIEKVSKEDNKYYVTVYAGLNDGNAVYGDFAKTKTVKTLTQDETYSITNEDKVQFTKINYTFELDGNGQYILKSFKVEK